MKLLVIGGYSRSLINFRGHLLGAMIDAGHEVYAAAPALLADDETTDRLVRMGVIPRDVSLSRTGLNPIADLYAFVDLVRVMRRIRPDAVLAYTAKPVIWSMLAARLLGVPRKFALLTGLGYAFAANPTGKRAVVGSIVKGLYRRALRRATAVFFQNPDDARLFRDLGLLAPQTPVTVVRGSGVDLQHYSPADLPGGPVTFLLIARLLGDKGIREFLQAAKQVSHEHPHARFDLVGPLDDSPDGIGEEELKSLLTDNPVRWHGEAADVRPFIADCHVYVLPSYREGTPRTVLEAMALGRAVITTDAPGCRETVEDGRNGFLVMPRSTEALAAAMTRFIETPSLAAAMGAESRRMAEEKFDVRVVNRQMLQVMGLA
jgi:glycosyltransferase involved in cell wall biosynthesis